MKKTIYYNESGQIDNFTTYINNHAWVFPVVVTILILITGIIEGF